MDARAKFGRIIRTLRQQRGITQRAVAKDLHITPQTLSYYERGEHDPGITFLCAIADYYGVSVDCLLGRERTVQNG